MEVNVVCEFHFGFTSELKLRIFSRTQCTTANKHSLSYVCIRCSTVQNTEDEC